MVKSLKKSTGLAWGGVLLVVIILVSTFTFRPVWWAFIDIFFFFLAAFCHAVACTFSRMNPPASSRLDKLALVCGILAVVAMIVEYVLYVCLM